MATTGSEVITIDGEEFYQWKAVVRIPKNWTPESGVFIAVAPPGGIANLPALVQGDNGFTPTIRNCNLTELAYGDPTEASATWTLVTAGTATTAPVFDLDLELHAGAPGDDGTLTILDADDLDDGSGGPTPYYILRVNAAGDGVELVAEKCGDKYWPTSFTTVNNGSGSYTLGQVTIPGHLWDYRPDCAGNALVTYDGNDVQVDLLARLDNATSGHIVARCFGPAGGAGQSLTLAAAPPAASDGDTYGRVDAGDSATLYFRAEQIGSGSDTFDISNTKQIFSVRVAPIPD